MSESAHRGPSRPDTGVPLVEQPGRFVTVVGGRSLPRVVVASGGDYPQSFVLAGDCGLLGRDAILTVAAASLSASDGVVRNGLEEEGGYELRRIDRSWLPLLELQRKEGEDWLQIVPRDARARTIDIPEMTLTFDATVEVAWSAIAEPSSWPFDFAPGTTVVANFRALLGEPVTEVARFHDGEFEMFAIGPDNVRPSHDDCRVVPVSTLVAHDASLQPLLDTPGGRSWWRTSRSAPWQKWRGWDTSAESDAP